MSPALLVVLTVIAAATPAAVSVSAAPSLTPFRTQAQPRVDPVFGDVAALRGAVDRFLTIEEAMAVARDQFSHAVHGTLTRLGSLGPVDHTVTTCPAAALGEYARAVAAAGRYLGQGRELEARFRDIRRGDDLGDTAGMTPDYRIKVKRARDLYAAVLRDFREMRVAFHDQLGAELKHAKCKPADLRDAAAAPAAHATRAADPSDPAAWELDDPDRTPADPADTRGKPRRDPAGGGGGPAIWIEIDNSRCAQPSRLAIDGQGFGPVAARKKVSVRTHAGPREVCVLPASDDRACGAPGTLRRAYLYEGWSLSVRCD